MNISICNAQLHHTGYNKNICCFFRIANAYTLRCRIANSAGRSQGLHVSGSAQSPACVAPSPVTARSEALIWISG
jgi:hypothetical protein